jgi:hypothetical protein
VKKGAMATGSESKIQSFIAIGRRRAIAKYRHSLIAFGKENKEKREKQQ